MKTQLFAAMTFGLSAAAADAGGIDRSGQSISDIFQAGTVAKFSFGAVSPRLSGVGTGDVGQGFGTASASYKTDLNDRLSVAIIWDQPFGSDVNYTTNPATSALGGTIAQVDSNAVTGVLRYKFDNGFSVHGGLRAQTASGRVSLSGQAFAGIGGAYSLDLARDTGFGYLAGVAYERPDIALRVALTYNSEIDHDFDSVDSRADNVNTSTSTPESLNLEFQSGIAKDTLLFGSVRYAAYDDFTLPAAGLGGLNLASIEDSTDYTIGIGRKLNDTWSISAVLGFSGGGDDRTQSALAPVGDSTSLGLAAIYTYENVKVTTGIRYTDIGDTTATVGGNPVTQFEDNSALSAGISVAYTF